jgi:hypothetical protein
MERFGGRFFVFLPLTLLLAVGCDNTTAGQDNEPAEAPRLTRIMAQPVNRDCTRCKITDLLNVRPPPACAVDRPCPVEFQVLNNPLPTCQIAEGATTGVCTDPLAAAPVGLGGDEGNAFRLVFHKPLDPELNDITQDAMGRNVSTLKPGILEIDNPKGEALAATAYYDPTGADVTSDAIALPFGPAIELDLSDALAPNTSYVIKLDSTRAVDRDQRLPADANGVSLPAPFTLVFTTEPNLPFVSVTPDISAAPNPTNMTPSIKPDNVIQLEFSLPVGDPMAAGSTATFTLSNGTTNIQVEAWRDQGAPGMCIGNPNQIDIVAVSAPGVPVPLAAGMYTLTVGGVVDGIYGNSAPYSASFTFFVAGAADPMDPNAVSKFYVPGAGACQ